jgi:hypothetical protein
MCTKAMFLFIFVNLSYYPSYGINSILGDIGLGRFKDVLDLIRRPHEVC